MNSLATLVQLRRHGVNLCLVAVVALLAAHPAATQNKPPSETGATEPQTTNEAGAEIRSATSSTQDSGSRDGERLLDKPLISEEALFEPGYWAELSKRLLDQTIAYLPRLMAAIVLFMVFWVLSRVVSGLLRRGLSRSKADPAVKGIVARLVGISIMVIGSLMALSQAGLPVGSLLASVGVLGLAVGLAAQDSLSNIVAGLIILWDRPFRVGDRVTIADEYGTVTDVGLRTTTVETVRDLEAILPNNEVISSKIINHTRKPALRIDVPIGIGYSEDIDAAREALLGCVDQSDFASDQRDPIVVVRSLGDSSVNLELRVWLKQPADELPALWMYTELAKKALDKAGIEIPFPQRTLHLPQDQGRPFLVTGDATRAADLQAASG